MNESETHQTAEVNGLKAELRDPQKTPWGQIKAELLIIYKTDSGEVLERSCGIVDPLDLQQINGGLLVADQGGISIATTEPLISHIIELASGLMAETEAEGEDTSNNAASVWSNRESLKDFLSNYVEIPHGWAKDIVFPGGLTTIAAPSSSGKTIVIHMLAYALAKGGVFRNEFLKPARVLILDYDNPRSIVQKRLRGICATHDIDLQIIGRDHAPQLLDLKAWKDFPAKDHDVVIVDSFGSATVGVSEKEGAKLQQCLRTLAEVADKGPAVIVLDNTEKSAMTYRGRGEKTERVDVFFEARDVTGWTPSRGDQWWRNLPNAADSEWAERAARKSGQQKIRIALVCRKFRWDEEPAPFVLEVDFSANPWSLSDVTAEIVESGQKAVQAERDAQQRRLDEAAQALCAKINELAAKNEVLSKAEAELFLRNPGGLTQKVARNLLDACDVTKYTEEGLWRLEPIPGSHGGKIGVFALMPKSDNGKNGKINPNKINGENTPSFRRPPIIGMTERWVSDPRINTRGYTFRLFVAEKHHQRHEKNLVGGFAVTTQPKNGTSNVAFKDTPPRQFDASFGVTDHTQRPSLVCGFCRSSINVSPLTGLCDGCRER